MRQLGNPLAHHHHYDEAIEPFRDAIANNSDSAHGNHCNLWYFFACVAAAANHTNESIQYLQEAIPRGYRNADGLMFEEDLKSLRGSPRFNQTSQTYAR